MRRYSPGLASLCKAARDSGRAAARSFDRHPDLHAAETGGSVELLGVALEIRRVRRLVSRLRQPDAPDRVVRAPERRDVLPMREHGVLVRGDAQPIELGRQVGEVGDLDTADVVEVAVVVDVVRHAVRDVPALAGNSAEPRCEPLPLPRDPGTRLARVAIVEPRDQERLPVHDPRRLETVEKWLVHGNSLRELDAVDRPALADGLGRDAELVAKRTRVRLVRTVTRGAPDILTEALAAGYGSHEAFT